MITSPHEKYRQSSVQTSSPSQLLLMLFDGAIRFVRAGLEALKAQDVQNTNLNFGKAQKIVSELMSTLDQKYEVSHSLYALYEYTNHLLIDANIKKNSESAEEALGYLTDLRETWAQAAKIALAGQEAQNG